MTRVLVTGAGGFAGSHVVKLLLDRTGWQVIPFDGRDDWDTVPAADVVFSLAATGDPKEALRDPAGAYTNDVQVMVETLEYARRVGARVLHVSSSEVYGPGASLPYRPRGPYAGGKACQEIVCGTYPDVPQTIVVTQSLFGERQQRDKLVPTVIRNLLTGNPVTLQRGPDGWALRPFLHARNLADALLHLAHDGPPRVHVGASVPISVERVARILANELGRPLTLEAVEVGDRAGHEATVGLIGTDVPGWQPTYETVGALRDVARWYRHNPGWCSDALADPRATYAAPAREARRAA